MNERGVEALAESLWCIERTKTAHILKAKETQSSHGYLVLSEPINLTFYPVWKKIASHYIWKQRSDINLLLYELVNAVLSGQSPHFCIIQETTPNMQWLVILLHRYSND